jgi:hypothetical protein
MEPALTKNIPNWAICNWYYLLFIVNVFAFIVILLATFIIPTLKGVPKGMMRGHMLLYVISGIFAATNALFYYLMCDRALKPM